jgi:hypothetical protein
MRLSAVQDFMHLVGFFFMKSCNKLTVVVVEHGIIGRLVSYALKRAWKEAVVAEFWCPGID